MPHLLRYSRIIIQSVIILVLTLGLCSASLCLPIVGEWLMQIQIGYAVAILSLATVTVWVIITLVLGRIYCSTACPLGTLQDISAAASRQIHRHHRHYSYRRPNNSLRYPLLAIMAGAIVLTITSLTILLDPFGLYSTVCSKISSMAGGIPSEAAAVITGTSLTTITTSAIILLAMVSASWRHGRLVCNTLCPIGTTLGFVSRYSIFQFDIDTDLCTQCGKCVDVCKSECIDLADHVVDGSRCVVCFDCTNVCPNKAIRYTSRRKQLSVPLMQKISDISTTSAPTQQSNQPSQQHETVSPTS